MANLSALLQMTLLLSASKQLDNYTSLQLRWLRANKLLHVASCPPQNSRVYWGEGISHIPEVYLIKSFKFILANTRYRKYWINIYSMKALKMSYWIYYEKFYILLANISKDNILWLNSLQVYLIFCCCFFFLN